MARQNRSRRTISISGAYMLRRAAQRGAVHEHTVKLTDGTLGPIDFVAPRPLDPRRHGLVGVRRADANTDSVNLEHGNTQQQAEASTRPAQASSPERPAPAPAVTPAQAAAAARIRVAADRKNGRKTDDWIVKLAHGA